MLRNEGCRTCCKRLLPLLSSNRAARAAYPAAVGTQLSKALKRMQELCPPKPKLLERATLMSICDQGAGVRGSGDSYDSSRVR